MAEQAGDIITDALIEVTALGAEAPIEAVDSAAAIRYLNRMMFALDADGINLGFTEVSNFKDDVTIPAGANEAIVVLLAYKLFNQFSEDGAAIPQTLVDRMRDGLRLLSKITASSLTAEFPGNLPLGSGNEGDTVYRGNHFYTDLEETILAETNGSLSLEDATE